MNTMFGILRELVGLVVDDGWLALAILGVVAVAAAISLVPGAGLASGAVLVVGCLAALLANVVKAAMR